MTYKAISPVYLTFWSYCLYMFAHDKSSLMHSIARQYLETDEKEIKYLLKVERAFCWK